MSTGCTTCNIYNRHTQYLQLKTWRWRQEFPLLCVTDDESTENFVPNLNLMSNSTYCVSESDNRRDAQRRVGNTKLQATSSVMNTADIITLYGREPVDQHADRSRVACSLQDAKQIVAKSVISASDTWKTLKSFPQTRY